MYLSGVVGRVELVFARDVRPVVHRSVPMRPRGSLVPIVIREHALEATFPVQSLLRRNSRVTKFLRSLCAPCEVL